MLSPWQFQRDTNHCNVLAQAYQALFDTILLKGKRRPLDLMIKQKPCSYSNPSNRRCRGMRELTPPNYQSFLYTRNGQENQLVKEDEAGPSQEQEKEAEQDTYI